MQLGDLVRRAGRLWDDRPAFAVNDEWRSWRELDQRSDALAAWLASEGVRPGDRVAVLADDSFEAIEAFYACLKAGFLRVGVNPRFTSGEVQRVLEHSDARGLIVDRRLGDIAAPAVGAFSGLAATAAFGDGGDLGDDYETVIGKTGPRDSQRTSAAEDADVALVYTTGSTGTPKGVPMSNDRLVLALTNILAHMWRLDQDDTWLHMYPGFGVGGMNLLLGLFTGHRTVVMPRYDVDEELRLIEKHRVTAFTNAVTMLQRLVDHDGLHKTDTSSLREVTYGSSPASPALIARATKVLRCRLQQAYGSTEGHLGFFTRLSPRDHAVIAADPSSANAARLARSCGQPLPHLNVDIVNDDGQPVPSGVPGEIVITGRTNARGYWGHPPEEAEVFRNGRLFTGDIGSMDELGYVQILDRKKFMIISGGINLFPAEIEAAVANDVAVAEVCVVGVPDPNWGEAVKAVVVLQPSAMNGDLAAVQQRIIATCRQSLAGFKIPKSIDFVESLPYGATGKIDKKAVRSQYWGGQARQVGEGGTEGSGR